MTREIIIYLSVTLGFPVTFLNLLSSTFSVTGRQVCRSLSCYIFIKIIGRLHRKDNQIVVQEEGCESGHKGKGRSIYDMFDSLPSLE